jgi:NAD(P)-dependent dehydrogenase (short-subunit alcohol dehydrogenase family)
MLRFDHRVVIVTGAGQGLGRAYALLLASRGATVVVNDLGCDELGRGEDRTFAAGVVDEIESLGGSAVASFDDVRTMDGGNAIVLTAIEAFGRVDAVVSNAALNTPTPVGETTLEELELHLALDPIGAYTVARAAWPHFVDQQYGRLVFSSSSAQFGTRTTLAYGAAKAATWGLMRGFAATGADVGVMANVVAPFGFSRMVTNNPNLDEAAVDARRRLMPAEQAAPVVAALVHESCPVNGELFAVGGGKVTNVFLGETRGIFDASLSPEQVMDSWDALVDRTDYDDVGLATHIADFQRTIPGWAEALAKSS